MAKYTRYIVTESRNRRPLWVRVMKIATVAAVCTVFLVAGSLVGWLDRTAAQVAKNNPAEVKAAKGQLNPVLPAQPVNILIIGSDRRVGQPDLGARSDTLMVVRLAPQTNSVSMLSVPRDLRVTIPGYGLDKINAAYSLGGARLAVETVKQVLHIPINDFIDVNFVGFVKVVDKLGGAYLTVDRRYYNNTNATGYASIDLQPGYQLLNGRQALSFVRFRHDQNGDFTRIERQQMFLREMKRELANSVTLSSFPRLLSVATIMSHYVVSDITNLTKVYGLVTLALKLDTNHIYQTHITGSTPTIGGVSYVVATPQEIAVALRQFLEPVGLRSRASSRTAAPGAARTPSRSATSNVSGRAGVSAAAAAQSQAGASAAAAGGPPDLIGWRALERRTRLPLYAPAVLGQGLGYDQFRAYRVNTGHGSAPAAVAVGTTPQGGYWDVQALRWSDPPILASPDTTRTIGGRSYALYYDGAKLHLIAWRHGSTTYWVSNTLDDELPNSLMLTLASSSVPVG